jgi:multiple sugar transport system permease protein
MAVELWRSFPFFTLFILAALLTIPGDSDEAAAVDGAGPLSHFRYITLPLIAPVMMVAGVLQAIRLFNTPDLLIVLTGGGPANSTQVGSLYAFQTAYIRFDFGYASAISLALMALMLGITLVAMRVTPAVDR